MAEMTSRQQQQEERAAIAYVDAYEHFSQELAVLNSHAAETCILAAAAAEAFINRIAQDRLGPLNLFEAVERLDPISKWLVVPPLLGMPPFKKGAEPIQSGAELFRARNRLMHFKSELDAAPQQNVLLPVTELEEWLSGQNAEKWYGAAKALIRGFFASAGEEVPSEIGRRHQIRHFPIAKATPPIHGQRTPRGKRQKRG